MSKLMEQELLDAIRKQNTIYDKANEIEIEILDLGEIVRTKKAEVEELYKEGRKVSDEVYTLSRKLK